MPKGKGFSVVVQLTGPRKHRILESSTFDTDDTKSSVLDLQLDAASKRPRFGRSSVPRSTVERIRDLNVGLTVVRNDRNYLYFGTHSEFGDDGFRRWVLIGYDIHGSRWFGRKVHLLDMRHLRRNLVAKFLLLRVTNLLPHLSYNIQYAPLCYL